MVQGGLQLLLGIRQLHADGAAAVDDLHGAGYLQLLYQSGNVGFGIVYIVPGGGADALGIHKALGDGLVHGHTAGDIVAAGIGHAQKVQGGLDAAILAAGAVKGQEHQIRQGAHLQNALTQHGGALIPPGAAHRLQVRSSGGDAVVGTQAVGRVENILYFSGIVFQAQEHIHQHRPVAPAAQGPAYTGTAGQGHIALGAETAGQNNDFHKASLDSGRILFLYSIV